MVRSVLTRFRAGPGVRAMAAAVVLLVAAGTAPAAAMPADLVVQHVQAEAKAGPPTDWQGAQWISPDTTSSWSNFVLDTDFTIKAAAAGIVFRATDSANYYLWQINTVTTPGKVMLRPHVQVGGHFTTLAEVDLSPVLTPANANAPHHLRIEADGATITTTIDGTRVDARTDASLAQGTIGFRTSTSAGVAEDALYDNYLADLPPGTALPSDAGNAQQPDMAGGQVTLAWTLYEQYGDHNTLAAQYPAMKAFVDTNNAQVPSHIWPDNRGFGDWCPPVHDGGANGGQGGPREGDCTSEVSLVNTALSYVQALDVAKAAQALGNRADAATYTALADSIKQAFNTRFLNADGSSYGDGRQTTSILPLAFDMVPAGNVTAVGNRLVDRILTTDGGHLDTGIFGTRYLVDALARVDRVDVAMTVLDQKTYPGFGYEISRGATSSWEEWLYSSNMETHDHAMFAGVNASLYTQLAGIQPAAPGYSALSITPHAPAGLSHVAASIDTAYGRVAVSWSKSARTFDLDVTIPVNTTATVSLPTTGGGRTAHAVGSGHWHWHVILCGSSP